MYKYILKYIIWSQKNLHDIRSIKKHLVYGGFSIKQARNQVRLLEDRFSTFPRQYTVYRYRWNKGKYEGEEIAHKHIK